MDPIAERAIDQLFGGWPFLDGEFRPQSLVAAVAAARNYRVHRSGLHAQGAPWDVLAPELAREIMARDLRGEAIVYRGLRDSERDAVVGELSVLRSESPMFGVLFGLPVKFGAVSSVELISCSAIHYPQHVFLGRSAFSSRSELREQLIHEYVHIWTYLIEELIPLSLPGPQDTYKLPSGTAGKTSQEVLGAAHVSAVLCRYYVSSKKGCQIERATALLDYFTGCLSIIASVGRLTRAGEALRLRLLWEAESLPLMFGGFQPV